MPVFLRLFVALAVPPEAAQAARAAAGGKPSSAAAHLTLKFLGRTERSLAPAVAQALSRVQSPPLDLTVQGLGCFKKPGGVVVWAGLAPSPPLTALRAAVEAALSPLSPGRPFERRPFEPHVTLARLKGEAGTRAAEKLKSLTALPLGSFRVDHFGLYASELTPDGAVHRLIDSWKLG
ncbi:MAG: RNA 2',3'-cyclic phosphodiesterase [Deltaproteobacteria bacterium]|nr:RNA 2',3'-cyclic phosphodiesterase [Deltaproteobacteria bacterium]